MVVRRRVCSPLNYPIFTQDDGGGKNKRLKKKKLYKLQSGKAVNKGGNKESAASDEEALRRPGYTIAAVQSPVSNFKARHYYMQRGVWNVFKAPFRGAFRTHSNVQTRL